MQCSRELVNSGVLTNSLNARNAENFIISHFIIIPIKITITPALRVLRYISRGQFKS